MKKIKGFFGVVILIALFLVGTQAEAKRLWMVDGLIGDATSGTSRYLDQIDSTSGVSNLANNDFAMYFNSGESIFQMFIYNSGITVTQDVATHPYKIAPSDDPALGIWYELSGISAFN